MLAEFPYCAHIFHTMLALFPYCAHIVHAAYSFDGLTLQLMANCGLVAPVVITIQAPKCKKRKYEKRRHPSMSNSAYCKIIMWSNLQQGRQFSCCSN